MRVSLRTIALVALASLSGCIWPMDTIPMIPLEFQGQVLSPGRVPLAGAEVRVWAEPPERVDAAVPLVAGRTDADGRFSLARTVRNRVPPAALTLRVSPPAGSGLATKTISGESTNVFPDYDEIGSRGYRYRTEVVLERAP